jgi:hypothetical protein
MQRDLAAAMSSGSRTASFLGALARDGYAVLPGVLSRCEVELLLSGVTRLSDEEAVRQRGGETYAVRNLLALVPAVRDVARSPAVRSLVEPVLGPGAFVARALLLDKTPEANWNLGWHQDRAIAVRRRVEVPGFGPWSVKAGVPHVRPPASVLARMLTVRLHLDACHAGNAPLRVLPGSHAEGELDAAARRRWREQVEPVACLVPRGGALLMRPLLLHASGAAAEPSHRRVIHLEFAGQPLPGGLEWFEASGEG